MSPPVEFDLQNYGDEDDEYIRNNPWGLGLVDQDYYSTEALTTQRIVDCLVREAGIPTSEMLSKSIHEAALETVMELYPEANPLDVSRWITTRVSDHVLSVIHAEQFGDASTMPKPKFGGEDE